MRTVADENSSIGDGRNRELGVVREFLPRRDATVEQRQRVSIVGIQRLPLAGRSLRVPNKVNGPNDSLSGPVRGNADGRSALVVDDGRRSHGMGGV